MARNKVLVVGLDGFDIEFARPLLEAGQLPTLQGLEDRGASFLLEHGAATRTGLAWEHYASGMSPETAGRSSVVELREHTYDAVQRGSQFEPSFAALDASVVVFDPPYTDITSAPRARGVVGWGAHDPGVVLTSNPPTLRDELDARFEPYPAASWTYESPWPSVERTAEMCAALVEGVEARSAAARWVLTERCADWDLAVVVTGEAHSAAEGLWHGVDPNHPLHTHASAGVAAAGMADLYRAIDTMLGALIDETHPTTVVAFSMGGMGSNNSDVPSMVLLPELMHRWSTGAALLEVPDAWSAEPTTCPLLAPDEDWGTEVGKCYPTRSSRLRAGAKKVVPARARKLLRRLRPARAAVTAGADQDLEWMPASWYRSQWPTMRAFALPSYYDGRVRVNLAGREPAGTVADDEYTAVLDEVEALVSACRNPATGEPVVRSFTRAARDPHTLQRSDADLVIQWSDPTCAFDHPLLGMIGPLPIRRTGGHTGRYGFAVLAGEGIAPGDGGIRSAFDVNPTITALLGLDPNPELDGTSLVDTHA
jgi:predicted AlkP superfamily phosphohydrolase/phosphomutase